MILAAKLMYAKAYLDSLDYDGIMHINMQYAVSHAYHSYESLICQLEKQWMTDAEQEF